MGYLHISNTYRPEAQSIFLFKEVYALEKIHGTSAHVSFKRLPVLNPDSTYAATGRPEVGFFAGGESYERFKSIFNEPALLTAFEALGQEHVLVYGEAYGGKCQGMSDTYGKDLKFVAFDVQIGETWLSVPNAKDVCDRLGIEFVHYEIIPATPEAMDAARLKPSTQAVRNGIVEPKMTEGVVVRPLVELITSNGNRVIAKHKNPEFSERTSKQDTQIDPNKKLALDNAEAVAVEFVTPVRLQHVTDKLQAAGTVLDIKAIKTVMDAMVEDVLREGAGEFEDTKDVRRAIAGHTSKLFRKTFGL